MQTEIGDQSNGVGTEPLHPKNFFPLSHFFNNSLREKFFRYIDEKQKAIVVVVSAASINEWWEQKEKRSKPTVP